MIQEQPQTCYVRGLLLDKSVVVAYPVAVSQWQLGLGNGTLFAVPIPDQFSAQGLEIQAAIEQAIKESEANGVSKNGKDATPWLLDRVNELSGGKSLQSSACCLVTLCEVSALTEICFQILHLSKTPLL